MKQKHAIYAVLAALLLVGGAILWLRPFSSAGQASLSLDESHLTNDDSPALPHSSGISPSLKPSSPEPISEPNAAQVYGDPNLTVGERFSLLLRLGDGGDEAAAHLALTIANQCHAIDGLSPDTPALGAQKVTDFQRYVDKQLRKDCRDVLIDPGFQKSIDTLRKHTANMYSDSVKQAIREAYADGGAQAGMVAGIVALKSRPDQGTVQVVGAQFSELEISSVYLAPLMHSAESESPNNRDNLVVGALQFLACDFGRPCGSDSFDVRMMCLTLGACIPGADLLTVTTREVMTAQQARDVQAILLRLRQFAPL